jgi:hypothetical protein
VKTGRLIQPNSNICLVLLLHTRDVKISFMIYFFVVKKVVAQCMRGYHGSVFTYGQTSSGKTFTMNGKSTSFSQYFPSFSFHRLVRYERAARNHPASHSPLLSTNPALRLTRVSFPSMYRHSYDARISPIKRCCLAKGNVSILTD